MSKQHKAKLVAELKGRRDGLRLVPMSREAVAAIDRYLRVRHSHPHAHEQWLWLGKREPLSDSGILQVMERRGRQAGVPGLHPHLFRHTFALRRACVEGAALQSRRCGKGDRVHGAQEVGCEGHAVTLRSVDMLAEWGPLTVGWGMVGVVIGVAVALRRNRPRIALALVSLFILVLAVGLVMNLMVNPD